VGNLGCDVWRLVFSALAAVFEAETFAVHFQDVDMMGQAVEKRAGKAF
jgi:hypothetical protein